MNAEFLRIIDSVSRDKNIDKESIFADLEAAMVSAVRKAFDEEENATVVIDRTTGDINATVNDEPVDMKTLGRIAAQTAKQVMIQKIREDERSAIFEEYSTRVGTVVTGTVTRYEGGSLTVNLGRGEGFLPRSEQIPGDQHHAGERIRAMILNVREDQNQVKIVLTQTHPDYIRKLFELEVPEVGERIIEIRALAREPGYRTKVAVSSIDTKVDAVGACVGIRGSRIRNIVDEVGGEKIDIVRWNESSQILIMNSLKPATVNEVFLCFELGRAAVIVEEDQLSLAIGKRGQNVRLAAQLTGWDIDILTPAEYNKGIDDMETALKSIEGVEDIVLDKMLAVGIISLGDLAGVGVDPLMKDLAMDEALANKVVEVAGVEAKRLAAEAEIAKAEAARARAAEAEAAKTEAAAPAGDEAGTDGDEPSEDAESTKASDELEPDSPSGSEDAGSENVKPDITAENSATDLETEEQSNPRGGGNEESSAVVGHDDTLTEQTDAVELNDPT